MSKVNRRKVIQEKEDFQLNFQLALSANSKKISSWLPEAKSDSHITSDDDQIKERDQFLNLPIISNGAGLSELDNEQIAASSQTIGSFLSQESTLKKQNINRTRDARTGSKAMSALMNKMRTDNRRNLADKYQVNKGNDGHRARSKIMEDLKKRKHVEPSKPVANVSTEDSDEEDSKTKQISGKKHTLQQFGKKGKSRPF